MNEIRFFAGADYTIRYELYNGKPHVVVPVVMMTEGVHNGIYHTAEQLGKYAHVWNDTAITINHPRAGDTYVSAANPTILEQYSVGRVFNTHLDGTKLKGEAWLEEDKLRTVSHAAYQYILEKKPMDVSLGITSDLEQTEGEWNGERYTAIASNLRPDHLALLPNGTGACSWADGGGVRANQAKVAEKPDKSSKEAWFSASMTTYEDSLSQVAEMVRTLIYAMDSDEAGYFVEDVFPTYAIYREEMRVNNSATVTLYKRAYTAANGNAVWAGEPVAVSREVTYRELNPVRTENTEGGNIMTNEEKKAKVDELVKLGVFSVADADKAAAMDETVLLSLHTFHVKKEEKPAEPAITVNAAIDALKGQSPDVIMNLFPENVRNVLRDGVAMYEENKAKLVERIMKSPLNIFAKEELEAKAPAELAKIAAFVKTEEPVSNTHFGLFGFDAVKPSAPVQDYSEEFLPIPSVEDLIASKG